MLNLAKFSKQNIVNILDIFNLGKTLSDNSSEYVLYV